MADAYIRIDFYSSDGTTQDVGRLRVYGEGSNIYSLDPGIAAARRGDTMCMFQNSSDNSWDSDFVASFMPITDTDMFYVVASNKIVMLHCVMLALQTASDKIEVRFVAYSGADMTGTATVLSPIFTSRSGATAQERPFELHEFSPPIPVSGASFGSVGLQARVNDASVEAGLGMHGWIEDV